MSIKGTILSAGRAQGLILGDDHKRYQFTPLAWSEPGAVPAAGARVEFEPIGDHALDISPIAGAPPPTIPTLAADIPTATVATPTVRSDPAPAPQVAAAPQAPVAPRVSPTPDPLPHPLPSGQKRPKAAKKRPFFAHRKFWLLAGIAIVPIFGIAGALFLLGVIPFGGPPAGVEVARQTHEGQIYVMVEYGDELAIFVADGPAVTQRDLAEPILWRYAWHQVIEDLDTAQLSDVSRKADDLAERVSEARNRSKDIIGFFDEIDDLRVDVPPHGNVSAIDAVRESFAGVDEAETIIRKLASDLYYLKTNAEALSNNSEFISILSPASFSGEFIDTAFRDTVYAANALEANAGSVRELVDGAGHIIADLPGGIRATSDTPIIGETLDDFAEATGQFSSDLLNISSQLSEIEPDLRSVVEDLEQAMNEAVETHEKDLNRWLEQPHDDSWSGHDPETTPVVPQPAEIQESRSIPLVTPTPDPE